MKRYILSALIALGCAQSVRASSGNDCCDSKDCSNRTVISCCECACAVTGKTFFSLLNLPWDVGAPMRESNRNYEHVNDEAKRNNLQVTVFGGRSTREGRVGAYFAPNCNNKMCSWENIADLPFGTLPADIPCIGQTKPCDMFAGFFGINTTGAYDSFDTDDMGLLHQGLPFFQSDFEFHPRHSFAGLGFSYRRHFCYNKDDNRSWWLEVGAPIMWVKNEMNLEETVIQSGGNVIVDGAPANMTEAFSNPEWKYGKIDCACDGEGKTGLADVDVRIGYEIVKEEICHFTSYFGGLIPTGTKPNSRRLFEPVIGHNRHGGVMFGTDLGIRLWYNEEKDRALWSEISLQGLYLFRNTQTRLLSLKNKPWSHFMPVFESAAQAQQLLAAMTAAPAVALDRFALYSAGGTPGVNVFAQDVRVSPAFQRRINAALVVAGKGFEGELGYNFFSRDDECVTFACKWPDNIVLKNPVLLTGLTDESLDSLPILNPSMSINDLIICRGAPVSLYESSVINACDLDLHSAASPGTIVHTVYVTAGYRWEEYKNPYFVSLGSSYEFSRDNTGLNVWTLWGKFGINF